ncbi:MAG: hypothetical protein IJA12_05035, partial [Oscillospiraceae bacterium]|nr:hypothetical protein [Oscillospiraceae bacterium]
MKRVNRIRISRRYLKIKWHTKLFIGLLVCVLIVMIGILIKLYFSLNSENKNNSVPDGNIFADFDEINNDYSIFSNDEGLLGVMDAEERYVIDPNWKNIYFLKDGRFAVEQTENSAIGIIDSDENYVTPFMFKELRSIGGDFLAAYFTDKDGFALLDISGNIISDKIWTSFDYDEKNAVLKNETGEYHYTIENNAVWCTKADFTGVIGDFMVNCISDDINLIDTASEDTLYRIFDSSCVYISAMLSGNISEIRNITNEQYYESLSAVSLFENCNVTTIKNLKIVSDNSEQDRYTFSAEITYDYQDGDQSINNLRSLVSLNFVNDENHAVILKSM